MKALNDVGIYMSVAGSAVGGFGATVNNPSSYSSYLTTSDCNGSSQNEIFTVYGVPLINGTRVWSDSAREILLVETTFVYNNVSYNTDNDGYIYSNSSCGTWSWVTYPTCNDYRDVVSSVTYYTAYANNALQVGVTLFTDDQLSTQAAVSQVVYAGIVYYLVNGVIESYDNCIYSLRYNIYGCGQADTDDFYPSSAGVTSTGVTNAALYGAVLRSSNGALLANMFIYRYGYGTYLQSDGNGQVFSEYSCPT